MCKFIQGKLATMQIGRLKMKKNAEMHAHYLDYKFKNEETEGQQEGQPEAETSAPMSTF